MGKARILMAEDRTTTLTNSNRLCVGCIPSKPYRFVEVLMVGSEVSESRGAVSALWSPEVRDLCTIIEHDGIGSHPRLYLRSDDGIGTTFHHPLGVFRAASADSHQTAHMDSSQFISLGTVLASPTTTVDSHGKLSEKQRRYLAVLLSLNALHLLATPWLKSDWGKNDIQLVGLDLAGNHSGRDFEFAFVNHTFENGFNRTR